MWVIRVRIEPTFWAYTRKGGAYGVYTTLSENARKYKTYDAAIKAEAKLRELSGLTHNDTEVSKLK